MNIDFKIIDKAHNERVDQLHSLVFEAKNQMPFVIRNVLDSLYALQSLKAEYEKLDEIGRKHLGDLNMVFKGLDHHVYNLNAMLEFDGGLAKLMDARDRPFITYDAAHRQGSRPESDKFWIEFFTADSPTVSVTAQCFNINWTTVTSYRVVDEPEAPTPMTPPALKPWNGSAGWPTEVTFDSTVEVCVGPDPTSTVVASPPHIDWTTVTGYRVVPGDKEV